MRPDKSGYWWWEDSKGNHNIDAFDDDLETMNCDETGYIGPKEFEELPEFKRWLGQAHPPKKVDVHSVGSVDHNLIRTSWRMIKEDDVKEYLLNGDDND